MWIIKMAWKNLWRNRGRTLITMTAIFFAVILCTLAESLKLGIFDNLVKNVVSFYTGYIQVHKKGYQDEQILDNSFARSSIMETRMKREKNIAGITARLESFALASSEELTKGCMVSGIDPQQEHAITDLKNKISQGNYLQDGDHGILLAQGLAERMQMQVGDTLVLIGQGYHGATAAGQYRVQGILKFGSPQLNDRMLYMTLSSAQDLFSAEGMITSYILSMSDNKQLDETANSLRMGLGKDVEVMTWEELLPDIKQHIGTDSNNMRIVQGILYLLICFGIFSTLMMMMMERRYEMGMLVAIGMKKGRIILLFMAESVITVLIGCVAGILCSVPLVFYLERHPLRIGGSTAAAYERFGFEAIFPASSDPSIFLYQGMIVLAIGLALSSYPAMKVLRLRPLEAMKR